jgi:hypothetical protein
VRAPAPEPRVRDEHRVDPNEEPGAQSLHYAAEVLGI